MTIWTMVAAFLAVTETVACTGSSTRVWFESETSTVVEEEEESRSFTHAKVLLQKVLHLKLKSSHSAGEWILSSYLDDISRCIRLLLNVKRQQCHMWSLHKCIGFFDTWMKISTWNTLIVMQLAFFPPYVETKRGTRNHMNCAFSHLTFSCAIGCFHMRTNNLKYENNVAYYVFLFGLKYALHHVIYLARTWVKMSSSPLVQSEQKLRDDVIF